MQRLVFALVLAASSLQAQYFDFAVTDDGTLYFSTALATPAAEDARFKVYRLTAAGVDLFATGGAGDPYLGRTASAPFVSGDGSITGWGLTTPCFGSCMLWVPRTTFQLQGAGIETITAERIQISRNGRYLVVYAWPLGLRLLELPSQRAVDVSPALVLAGPQSIADNGALLLSDGKSLLLRPPDGEPRAVAGSAGAVSGVLGPAGDRIAFERVRDGRLELVLGDVAIDAAPGVNPRFQPRFANDGALLYLDADSQPVYVTPGGTPRRLATLDSPAQRAIVSGDGRIAWVATAAGQLLRIHTIDGSIEEAVPATPLLGGSALWAYPGSVIRFSGTGVTRDIRFQIDGARLPLSAIAGDAAYVQIPWEYPAAATARALTVQAPGSPFFQRFDFTAFDLPRITFERQGSALKAAHQDFRGLATPSDPARPGETLHVFASNMGPVDRPVATGEPSPDPPARVTTPMACYLIEFARDFTPVRSVGLVVPFAGLSAGLIGVYHIDVTIPADWTATRSMLSCHMDVGDRLYHGDSVEIDISPPPGN